MKKAILWDNDGVLVHTEGLYFQAGKKVLEELGINATEESLKISLQTGKSIFSLAREQGFSDEKIINLRDKRNEIYSDLLKEQNTAIPGMEDVLKTLHENKIIMGIVTTSRKDHFDLIHEKTGFTKYFNFILTREDYDKAKPHPEPYLKGLQLAQCSKEECIVVEDSKRGQQAAKAAEIDCVVIPNELTASADFSDATKVVNSPKGLLDYLLDIIK